MTYRNKSGFSVFNALDEGESEPSLIATVLALFRYTAAICSIDEHVPVDNSQNL